MQQETGIKDHLQAISDSCFLACLPPALCRLQVAMHVIRQHRYRPPGEDGRGGAVQVGGVAGRREGQSDDAVACALAGAVQCRWVGQERGAGGAAGSW